MIRTLLSHSLVYGLTTIAARGALLVSLLVLPAILAPADYGALAMLALVGNLAAVVVPLQVGQGLARHYGAARGEAEKRLYASSAWWFSVFAQLSFLALGQVFAQRATVWVLGDGAYVPAVRIALVVMVLNSLFFFLQSQFRWAFRPRDFVIASLTYSFLTLGLSVGFALLWPVPLLGVLAGQAAGAAAGVLWAIWRLRDNILARPHRPALREMLAFAAPLVPAALAVALISYSARIVLNDLGSLADVGVFALASQIASIATLAIVGLQAAMTPLVTVHHADPSTPRALGRVFQAFCAAAFVICLMLGLFASEAIGWLDNPEYARAGPLVLLMAPAVLLVEMYIFAPGFWISKRTGLQAALSTLSAAFAFAAAYLLIGAFDLSGAALASLASGLFFFISWWMVSRRFYFVPVAWVRLLLFLLAGAAAGAGALQWTEPGTAAGVAAKLVVIAFVALLAVVSGLVPWREGVVAAASHLRRGSPASPTSGPDRR
ncbi:MAG: oligosaccharide flippase family protein [Pseudomonadota bacterium]|nr:oligosaccharide flippase family protein [Pseudomonadota bacterium]